MRRNRLMLLAAWIISIVIISFYGGAVSYGLFTMLTLIPVISLLYIILVAFSYRIYQKIETNDVVSNHTVNYYFSLQNETPFLFPGIKVDFYSDFSEIVGLDSDTEYELSPKNGLRIDTELVCKYRGEYEVGVKTVTIQDPFRLFRFTFKNPEPLSAKVKPDVIELSELRRGNNMIEMKRESKKNKNERDVLLRSYVAGDEVKNISWKASAKTGELLVRRNIGEEKGRVRIVLDTFRYAEDRNEYIPLESKELETVIALSLYYIKKNIPVTLSYVQGNIINEHFDLIGQFEDYYSKVSEIRFSDTFSSEMLLNAVICDKENDSAPATVFVFHDWNTALANTAVMLTEMGNGVDAFLVTDDAKEDISISGLTQTVIPINKALEDVL